MIYGLTLPMRNKIWARFKVPVSLMRAIRIPLTFLVVALTLVLVRSHDIGEAFHAFFMARFSALLCSRILLTSSAAFGFRRSHSGLSFPFGARHGTYTELRP